MSPLYNPREKKAQRHFKMRLDRRSRYWERDEKMRDVNMIGYRCDVEGIIAQAILGSSSG